MTPPLRDIGDYQLLQSLASGGMGEVSLARRRGVHGFEKFVAVKTILSRHEKNSAARKAFLDEARLLAQLDHPAVAGVLDFGEDNGSLYLVLEYVAGVRFDALVERAHVPPRALAELFAQVCHGLDAAHELRGPNGSLLGVVHRDVSPQNIILTFSGMPKIIDFGIAFAASREQPTTEFGHVKGKPSYMAPEQWRSERVDRRTDVFSAGVVLYEALTRRRLFTGDSVYAIGMSVCNDPIPPPSTLVEEAPLGFDRIVGRALHRDPSARYPTALAMAEDLEDIARRLSGESLVEYAREALQADEEAHRHRLRTQTSDSHLAPGAGRPPGQETEEATLRTSRRPRLLIPGIASIAILAALALSIFLTRETGPAASEPTRPAQIPASTSAPISATPIDAATETRPLPKVNRKPRRKRARPGTDSKEANTTVNGVGRIDIFAEPYARIRIDGKDRGTTPQFALPVAAGARVLELVHPADGRVRHRVELRVEDGEKRRIRAPPLAE